MEDLRLVGVNDDGERLVVESAAGERFGLALDERLHAALRGDRARLGQLQIAIENELRPAEIQRRIRAGETAQQIADAAGLPVERVRRFEGPILLERTVVAQNAQKVGVRRVTDAQTTALGDLVRSRLEGHDVPAGSVDWDSWLHPGGGWVVRLVYRAGDRDRSASWLFDPRRRSVEPLDDDARWLTDEERAAPERPVARRAPRLAAVPAAEAVPPVGRDTEAARHDTVPLSARRRARAVPDLPPGVGGDDTPPPARAPLGATRVGGAPADPATDPSADPGSAPASAAARSGPAGPGRPRADQAAEAEPPARADEHEAEVEPRRVAQPSRGRSGKRPSIPSWDEILFGAPKRDRD